MNNENQESGEEKEIEIPSRVKELWEKQKKEPLSSEEEKEINELLFGPAMPYVNVFKFHSFTSIAKVRDYPNYEWVGETVADETVVVAYKNGDLFIGTGRNEIKARQKMECLASSKNKAGETKVDRGLTLEKINTDLKLEWVLPEGLVED